MAVKNKIYLANAFSLNMLDLYQPETYTILKVTKGTLQWFKKIINDLSLIIDCAIGHPSTAKLVETLTGIKLNCERKPITLNEGDGVIVIQLGFRPEEGKVYTYDELIQLLNQGKISFYYVYREQHFLF